MHIGKERLEAIDTVKMQKHLMLAPAMSLQDLEHGWFEVVVDCRARHASPELKRMALPQQEGFLALGREAFHKHGSRKAKATGQEWDFDQLAPDFDGRLAKVELGPLPWRKVERNIGWFGRLVQLPHEEAHRRFADVNAQFVQFHPHSMRRPTLFWCPAAEPFILFEPALDMRQGEVAYRRFGDGCLSALIAAFLCCWLLLQKPGNRMA